MNEIHNLLIDICLPDWPVVIIGMVMDYAAPQGEFILTTKNEINTLTLVTLQIDWSDFARKSGLGHNIMEQTISESPNPWPVVAAIRMEQRIYCLCVRATNVFLQCYDLLTKTWSLQSYPISLPEVATLVKLPNSSSFVVFGRYTNQNNIYLYDTLTEKWSQSLSGMTYPNRNRSTCITFQDKIYVFGGIGIETQNAFETLASCRSTTPLPLSKFISTVNLI